MSEHSLQVAHQFETPEQQHEASFLGMWLFLASEVLFLGGAIGAYTVYRVVYADAFTAASAHLNVTLGAINTAVLLCSSLTMALAVHTAQAGRRRLTVGLLLLTVVLGLAFLGIKATEYYQEYREGLVPLRGFVFEFAGPEAPHAQLFFSFYFALTGLHALHMIVGIGIVLVMAWLTWRAGGAVTATQVEMGGLFWHFVDIVWVFLFPLLYLVG